VTGVGVGHATITATSTVDASKKGTRNVIVTSAAFFSVYGYRLSGQNQRMIISELNAYEAGDVNQTDLLGYASPAGINATPLTQFGWTNSLAVVNDGLTPAQPEDNYASYAVDGSTVIDVLGVVPLNLSDNLIVEVVLTENFENQMNGLTITLLDASGNPIGTQSSAATGIISGNSNQDGLRVTFSKTDGSIVSDMAIFGNNSPTVNSVSINGSNHVEKGENTQLTAIVDVANGAAQTVPWSSSNPSVATVTANGLVTEITEGNATITATSTVDNSKKGTLDITITAPTFPLYGYRLSGQTGRMVIAELSIYSSDGIDTYNLLNYYEPTGINLAILDGFAENIGLINDGGVVGDDDADLEDSDTFVSKDSTGGAVLEVWSDYPQYISGNLIVDVLLGVENEHNNNGLTVTLLDSNGNPMGTTSSPLTGINSGDGSQDGFRVVFSPEDGSIVNDMTIYDNPSVPSFD
jgi:hypothetical protein